MGPYLQNLKAMNFVIDIGNTLTKLAVFQGREMVAYTSFEGVDVQHIRQFLPAE
jgi:pantothenate kinase type III